MTEKTIVERVAEHLDTTNGPMHPDYALSLATAALDFIGPVVFGSVGECLAGMPHSDVSPDARRKIERALDRVFAAPAQSKGET